MWFYLQIVSGSFGSFLKICRKINQTLRCFDCLMWISFFFYKFTLNQSKFSWWKIKSFYYIRRFWIIGDFENNDDYPSPTTFYLHFNAHRRHAKSPEMLKRRIQRKQTYLSRCAAIHMRVLNVIMESNTRTTRDENTFGTLKSNCK